MPLLDNSYPYALIFDIGGGSTEIIWIKQHHDRPAQLIALLSMPLGVVTLAEEYGFGAIDTTLRTAIINRIDAHLAAFDHANSIAPAVANGQVQMLGTSGTVTTLGAIELGLPRYQRSKVDGLYLDLDKVNLISGQLTSVDFNERARMPCVGRGRADLVAVGCTILEALCGRWPANRLRIADRGIREGLLMAMIAADRAAQAATASS
jgi:exopolyphosphatase/guanosine-5'-triphosphate,3'-diphosphate pyrophosphatase